MKNISKERPYDEKCEKIVGQILSFYFYMNHFITLGRVTNKELQVRGVDYIASKDNKTYYIDEKAAIKYIGLKTFALELSFFNRKGEEQIGWLLDETKINTHYLFVWINELNHEKIIDMSSIKNMDVALVSKEKILNYLQSIGWDQKRLKRKLYKIRNYPDTYMGNINKHGCKFSHSTQLVEKPINILLPKEKYIELAEIYQNIII